MNDIASGDPINLNNHSGGTNAVICTKSAGRCGRGRVSARKASFFESNEELWFELGCREIFEPFENLVSFCWMLNMSLELQAVVSGVLSQKLRVQCSYMK